MKSLRISIDGKDYPCYVTMGAFLEFRNETGREVADALASGGVTDQITWLWSCVRSASRRDGDAMTLSLMEFADMLDPETLSAWASASADDSAGSKKR